MKTSHLKSTAIAILALANVCLLLLLAARRQQEHSAKERVVTELVQMFASSGVELKPAAVPVRPARLAEVETVRAESAEASLAAALLGPCEAEDMGGGIFRYSNAAGTCFLRGSGSVEASLSRRVEDPEAFCKKLFAECGYEMFAFDVSEGTGKANAVRVVSDTAVFNAELSLSFERGSLISAAGTFVPPVELREDDGNISAVTALVRFLDYGAQSGEVCTAIYNVRSGYLVQGGTLGAQRMMPVWSVETDVAQYYVNMKTGEVTREN